VTSWIPDYRPRVWLTFSVRARLLVSHIRHEQRLREVAAVRVGGYRSGSALVTRAWLPVDGSVGARGDTSLTYMPAINGELLLGVQS